MKSISRRIGAAIALVVAAASATAHDQDCRDDAQPTISFIQFQSPNIAVTPVGELTIKGKLSVPAAGNCGHKGDKDGDKGPKPARIPAVVILHGSSGVDARGDFYEAALNAAGIATLQIDMWEARGVTGVANRPKLPIFTYPDAFSALAYLSALPGIDAKRIGVLGFSWGGVISLISAEQLYSTQFGNGLKFAAHVAHYPVCWGANVAIAPPLTAAQAGTQFINLTGAPLLIQVGSLDDYDLGAGPCQALAAAVNPSNDHVVSVNAYAGAYHAWDRLMVPSIVADPFANRGSYFKTGVVPNVRHVPDVAQALLARQRVVAFFKSKL